MAIKVRMVPSDAGDGKSGILQVVSAYKQYLPKYGVKFTESDNYDLLATHAGALGAQCDVAHCHGLYWTFDYEASSWEYKANAQVIAALRNAKQITVPSQWVAQVLRRDMHVNPHVVPHGINWQQWQGGKSQGYVLYNKNRQGDVCDATPLSYLAEHVPSLPFVTTFATTELPNITVTGTLPHSEMAVLVKNAGVYFAPTKETFGIGILEAMAAGVPVLGYAHGGILDLVQHGVNGYLVPPGDTQGLLEGLAYCLQYRDALGANGRELARAYTWDKVAEQVAGIYQLAMEDEPPTAAIIIPTFNYGNSVGHAINSAINQNYEQLTDIIVVDDGSSDGTDITEWLQKDKRVRYIKQVNQGVAWARNNGITLTNAKYICCLDADDWIEPTFLEATIPHLEKDRTLGIAYTGLMLHGGNWSRPGPWPTDSDYDKQVRGDNQVPTCCVFRRKIWEQLGGYRQRYAPGGAGTEDAEFWLRIGSIGYDAHKVTNASLFHYTLGGRTTGIEQYRATGWLDWHPWTVDKQHPFASVATPVNLSHQVRQYDTPLVSVIIPVGPGHERHVIEALDSLEAQTLRQWEGIVVWDTGESVPNTLQKAYPYVQWIVTEGSVGAGKARNIGAQQANAPFLVFLDADDWLMGTALEYMLLAYSETEAIVYSESYGIRSVDEAKAQEYERRGELIKYQNGIATVQQRVAEYNYDLAIQQPFQKQPYFWCYVSSLIPKVWHDEVGGFDEVLEAWEDWDYWIRLAKRGKPFVAVDKPLLTYCYDSGNRRETGRVLKDALRQQLIEKHKELKPMPCSGCGKKRVVINTPPPATQTDERTVSAMSDESFVLIEYMPARGGSHGVVGLTTFSSKQTDNMRRVSGGWVFDYGYRARGDKFLVHRLDQRALPNWFRIVAVPDAQRVVRLPVPSQPVATPPPPVIKQPEGLDLQLLPGITPALAKAMQDAGFDTKDAILTGDLTTVKGIGAAKASAIKEALNVIPEVSAVLDELRQALAS